MRNRPIPTGWYLHKSIASNSSNGLSPKVDHWLVSMAWDRFGHCFEKKQERDPLGLVSLPTCSHLPTSRGCRPPAQSESAVSDVDPLVRLVKARRTLQPGGDQRCPARPSMCEESGTYFQILLILSTGPTRECIRLLPPTPFPSPAVEGYSRFG